MGVGLAVGSALWGPSQHRPQFPGVAPRLGAPGPDEKKMPRTRSTTHSFRLCQPRGGWLTAEASCVVGTNALALTPGCGLRD